MLGLERPTVAILNIGEEDLKGNVAVKKAAAILQQSDLSFHFDGFVEGDDIGAGTVDVIVTDGFTGNIALKTMEEPQGCSPITSRPPSRVRRWLG